MFTLRATDDVDEVRELHELSFDGDRWVGDHHAFWIAKDDDGRAVGFCSAIYNENCGYVFLSRAAVILAAQGHGLQRRMIRTRVNWARRIGAQRCITYTSPKNYQSMTNLLRCGFRFYVPKLNADEFVRNECHYFRRDLNG